MRCTKERCGGEVNLHSEITVFHGLQKCQNPAYACKICGRLHWRDGAPLKPRVILRLGKVVPEDPQEIQK